MLILVLKPHVEWILFSFLCVESLDVDEVEFSNGDGKSPPFTLSCVTLNRPPTRVKWYLNGKPLHDVIPTTVLDNPVTTQYTNTLTVTERRGGRYKCHVTSDSDLSTQTESDALGVQGMFGVYYIDFFSSWLSACACTYGICLRAISNCSFLIR